MASLWGLLRSPGKVSLKLEQRGLEGWTFSANPETSGFGFGFHSENFDHETMMNSSSSKMRRRSSVSQQLSAARQYRLQALREDVIDIRLQMDTRRPHEPDAVFVPTFRYHGKRRAGDELVGSSFYETLGKTHKRGSLPNLKPSRALVEGASKGGIQSQGPGSEVGTSARASAASNFDSATSDAQQDKGERGEEGNEGEGEVGHDNILLEAKQDLTPEEFDLIRAKLVLATAKRKPADARYLSNPELRSFSKNMTKRQRKELNALVAEFVDRTSKAVREKFEKKRTELVSPSPKTSMISWNTSRCVASSHERTNERTLKPTGLQRHISSKRKCSKS